MVPCGKLRWLLVSAPVACPKPVASYRSQYSAGNTTCSDQRHVSGVLQPEVPADAPQYAGPVNRQRSTVNCNPAITPSHTHTHTHTDCIGTT